MTCEMIPHRVLLDKSLLLKNPTNIKLYLFVLNVAEVTQFMCHMNAFMCQNINYVISDATQFMCHE
jgi:hypothetical protein